MLWDSTSAAALEVHRVLKLQTEEALRRREAEDRHLLLRGHWRELVAAQIAALFADPQEAQNVAVMADVSLNVFKYVITETYQYRGARRSFRRADGSQDPVYQELVDPTVKAPAGRPRRRAPFDLVMGEVTETLGGLRDALVRVLPGPPGPDGAPGLPRMRVFKPHECTVIAREDEPGEPWAVFYETKTEAGRLETVVWTSHEHYVITEGGGVRPARGATGTVNELGRLPFVAMHHGLRASCFWDRASEEDLKLFTLQYAAGWSAIRHLAHNQSFSQLVAEGVDEQWKPPAKRGPGFIWKVTPGGSLTALDLKTDPGPLVEMLLSQLTQHLASRGLDVNRFLKSPGQSAPSGLAHFMERQNILERRREVTPFLEEGEHALAGLYREMWNVNHDDEIDPTADFQVEVLEETVVMSPQEKADLRAKQLANFATERTLGLRSRLEQIAEDRDLAQDLDRAREVAALTEARPELFAYHLESGIPTWNQVLASLGLPERDDEDGKLTLPELRAKYPERYGATAPKPSGPTA